ncbi:MAG: sigma-70 family RNA polymerase sigma factor [Anaerolineae bacterium]|nr:sigma-70 family RNA polymerase sigma factor [Anaerolineae bacterium]
MERQHHRRDDLGQPTEAVLFHQAQTGGRESLNTLMETHDGLVHAVVRRQVLGDLPYAEALQAGRIGLWRAILRFEPDRGHAFSTYAWPSIVHHVWRAVKVHTRASRAQQAQPEAEPSEWQCIACTDPATIVAAWTVHYTLHALVARLGERLRSIIVARYGLSGQGTCFYREIGAHLAISGERVRQLHSEALVWLRHPAHSYHLRSLLNRHQMSDYLWAEQETQRWLRKRGGRHGRS